MLIALANTDDIIVGLWALRIDANSTPQPYLSAIHYPIWVLLIATQIARNYRLRVDERNQTLRALEHSQNELRQLTAELLKAREEERTAIARKIHDELDQALTALKMDMSWIDARSPADAPATLRQKLTAMTGLIDNTIITIHRIATNLKPNMLDDLKLAATMEWQAQEFEQRTNITCSLRTSMDDAAFDRPLSTALFRILQESLTNVARHSRARLVAITLEHSSTDIVLEVRDDGIGITAADATNGHSIDLAGMRERAQLMGDHLSISGREGNSTTVRVRVPRRDAIAETGARAASSQSIAEAL